MRGPRFLLIGFAIGAIVGLIFSKRSAFAWAWAAFCLGACLTNEISLYRLSRGRE